MISRRTFGLGILLLPWIGQAAASDQDFAIWLNGLRRDAEAAGVSRTTLNHALAHVALLPRVLELDSAQPETTLTFEQYLDRVVSPARRQEARRHFATNRRLLEAVGARYRVPPQYIVALWGIETNFGRDIGKFPVISALATLAFGGRRAAFFRGELIKALIMVEREHIDPRKMVGSWAGAMGQSQFMPSSFLKFAVSYRGLGPPDIWDRRDDVFASIANYLARDGWQEGEGWGCRVSVPPALAASTDGAWRPVAAWSRLGIHRVAGERWPAARRQAGLVMPGGTDGPAFLVLDNYRVLLKWNRSNYFAIAVGYLADDLSRG